MNLRGFGGLNLYNACVEWWRMSLLCADHHFHFASHPPRPVYVSPYILHLKRPSHSSQTQKESVICLPYLPAWCLCVSVCVVLFLVCMCVCLILYWFYYTMLCHYCHWHIWHKIYFSLIFLCLNSFICLTILLLYLFFPWFICVNRAEFGTSSRNMFDDYVNLPFFSVGFWLSVYWLIV